MNSFNITVPANSTVSLSGYSVIGYRVTTPGAVQFTFDGTARNKVVVAANEYHPVNISMGSNVSASVTTSSGASITVMCSDLADGITSGQQPGFTSALSRVGVGTSYATPTNTQKIRSAMARSDRNAIVVIQGDSTARGVTTGGGTSQALNATWMQVASQLQKQGINAGANNFFGDATGWGLGAQTMANFAAGDSRISYTGSIAPGTIITAGGNGFSVTAAGSLAFAPPNNVTKFDIYTRDSATGRQYSWAIDGGAATTVSSLGVNAPQKTTVSAGAAGLHSVNFSWVAGNVGLLGMHAYDDTAGRREISFLNFGIPGATSSRLLNNADTGAGHLAMLNAMAPDLTILDGYGLINDWRQSVDISVSMTNLLAGITQARLTGDVVFITPFWDNGTSGTTAQQDAYSAAAVALCLANNVPIIDVRAAWVSFAAANALGWYSDTVHPVALGYAVKAAAIVEFFRRLKGM